MDEAIGALERLVGGGRAPPSLAEAVAALCSAGFVGYHPKLMLLRLGYTVEGCPPTVQRAGLASDTRRLRATLQAVARKGRAAPDSFRFAATLRLALTHPKAPLLQTGYGQEVVRDCRADGLAAMFDQRQTEPRACVLRFLDKTIGEWPHRAVFPRPCHACGTLSNRVIMLSQPVCCNVEVTSRSQPCVLASPQRPFDEPIECPWECLLSMDVPMDVA